MRIAFCLRNALARMGWAFHYVFPYNKYFSICKIFDSFYSSWIKHAIGNTPRNVTICKHCTLIGGKYMKFLEGSSVGRYSNLEAWSINNELPEIIFGEHCCIGEYNHISASNRIIIGRNVLTGRRVTIIDNNHGEFTMEQLNIPPLKRPVVSKGDIVIEDNVWIGENVVILSNVHIGKGSVIAANAVVTKDIPAYSLAAGVPAIVIKTFDGHN